MASLGPKKLYLVVESDNHADEQYEVYFDREEALKQAQFLSDFYAEMYGHTVDINKPSDTWLFCHQGEERWYIAVVEVPVTYTVVRVADDTPQPRETTIPTDDSDIK